MKVNQTSVRIVPLCLSVLMLGACATRTVERQVVREQPIVQQPIVQQAPAQPVERVVVMPAAPQEQIPPAPAATGYTWVAGHYVWRDGWTWERGHWVEGSVRPMPSPYSEAPTQAPAPEARWIPGYWEYVGNDWEWRKGHWASR
jgi:hypothetical protein